MGQYLFEVVDQRAGNTHLFTFLMSLLSTLNRNQSDIILLFTADQTSPLTIPIMSRRYFLVINLSRVTWFLAVPLGYVKEMN